MISPELKARIDARNAEMETQYYILCTEAQMVDLAAGYVPNSVKGMCRTMLDFALEDERKAAANLAQVAHAKRKKAKA